MLFNADKNTKENLFHQIKKDAEEFREKKFLDV